MKLQSRRQRLKACPDTNLLRYGQSGIVSAAEVPASDQLLRLPISTGSCQFAKIFRTIDIPRNPGQFEDNTGQARRLRCGQVRQEAVVPEAKREQVTRRSPRCIRAATGRVRYQPRAAWRSAIDDLLQFRTVDQRN